MLWKPSSLAQFLLINACLLILAQTSMATPSITSVSPGAKHGLTVTITGAGFGSKTTAAPLIYDDFDDGQDGSNLSWWSLDGNLGIYPKYSTARSHNGNQCARSNFESQYNCTAYKRGYDLDEVYFSYWIYWEKVSGDDSRNMKLGRVTSDTASYKDGTPSLGYTGFYTTSSIWYAFNGNSDGPDNDVQVWGSFVTGGSWHRIEMYGKVSTLNQNDGARGWWLDLDEVSYDDTFPTYTSATERDSYRCFLLPFYVAHDAGGPHNIYSDDVYIDNTRSRVEVGNASTWADCTTREIQPATFWASDGDSITFTANVSSSFSAEYEVYLYVVTAGGSVSPGYAITVGESGGAVPPTAAPGQPSVVRDGNTATLTTTNSVPAAARYQFEVGHDARLQQIAVTEYPDIEAVLTIDAAKALISKVQAVDSDGNTQSTSDTTHTGGS